MRVPVIAFLLALLIAAGCSSGENASGSTPTTAAALSTTSAAAAPASTEALESTEDTSDDEQDAASTTSAETVADPEEPIEQVVADRIRGYFAARAAANSAPAPNPDDPRLAEFAVSEELAAVVANTQARLDVGQAIRPGEQNSAEIRVGFVEAGVSGATAAACSVDDGVIFDVATGAVVNDDVVTHSYQINLELHNGAWKVSRIVRVQQWEGVAGCALSPADYPY